MPAKWTATLPMAWRRRGAEITKLYRGRRFLGVLGKAALRRFHGSRPATLREVDILRRLVAGEAALGGGIVTYGSALRNPVLADRLEKVELGIWSLGPESLNFVERKVAALRPRLILELGSGISTVCLSQYMREVHGEPEGLRVISIDQNARFADQTARLLGKLGLSTLARVFHCPLTQQEIAGVLTDCYDISNPEIVAALEQGQPDLLLIDGPAADEGGRFGTLPLFSRYLAKGATFVLDDALRDGERATASRWSKLPNVQIDGIHLIEKGLLVGRMRSGGV